MIVNFPYTDQAGFKRRPALVILVPPGNNLVLVHITSQNRGPYPISITQEDLITGTLTKQSYVQPDVIVTVNESIIHGKAGSLNQDKFDEILDTIVHLFQA